MTDVVWVALISAGGAVLGAWVGQYLSARSASKLAALQIERDAAEWERTERVRSRERLEQKMGLIWEQALLAQLRMADGMAYPDRYAQAKERAGPLPFAETAIAAAGQAFSLALVAVPQLRAATAALYEATATCEAKISNRTLHPDNAKTDPDLASWHSQRKVLEVAIALEVEKLRLQPKKEH